MDHELMEELYDSGRYTDLTIIATKGVAVPQEFRVHRAIVVVALPGLDKKHHWDIEAGSLTLEWCPDDVEMLLRCVYGDPDEMCTELITGPLYWKLPKAVRLAHHANYCEEWSLAERFTKIGETAVKIYNLDTESISVIMREIAHEEGNGDVICALADRLHEIS